jgi:UDP-N-acetylmuramate--alanine ligase
MLLNVMAVLSVCYLENIDKEEVKKQVLKIKHAKRRFIETKFQSNILIDDYAHHPTEVKVTIEAARKKYPDRFIVAIFKAHTRSRVEYFHKEFADALNLADKAYVMTIGEDRKETGYDKVSHEDILKDTKNGEFISLETADKLLQYKNAVLLFMSSKDIYFLEDRYKELANKK